MLYGNFLEKKGRGGKMEGRGTAVNLQPTPPQSGKLQRNQQERTISVNL